MSKHTWSRQPPILKLLIRLEKTRLNKARDSLNEQLTRAKAMLENQLLAMKSDKNGK